MAVYPLPSEIHYTSQSSSTQGVPRFYPVPSGVLTRTAKLDGWSRLCQTWEGQQVMAATEDKPLFFMHLKLAFQLSKVPYHFGILSNSNKICTIPHCSNNLLLLIPRFLEKSVDLYSANSLKHNLQNFSGF